MVSWMILLEAGLALRYASTSTFRYYSHFSRENLKNTFHTLRIFFRTLLVHRASFLAHHAHILLLVLRVSRLLFDATSTFTAPRLLLDRCAPPTFCAPRLLLSNNPHFSRITRVASSIHVLKDIKGMTLAKALMIITLLPI